MFFEWRNELDIGVEPMNDEHKHLIALMNVIFEMAQAHKPKDEIEAAIGTLQIAARDHFAREEVYLESIGYPGLKQHKEIHTKLLERFAVHVREYQQGNGVVPRQFFDFMKMWLSAHIMGIDKHYGEFSTTQDKAS